MVCLPRDLHGEHAPFRTELVSAGHVQDLGSFHALGQGFGFVQLGKRSLLCSGNGDEPWESMTSPPPRGPGLCEELGQQNDVLLFKYQAVVAPWMTSTLLNDSGIRTGTAMLTFAN